MKKIILNQKSYLSYDEMTNFIKQYEKLDKTKHDFILFPPVVYLSLFKDKPYKVGTQNFFSYNYGSFTGEISLEQLKSMNIKYTLVSHPERKKIIGETYEIAKEKLYKSLSSKFNTILYIGELSKMRNPISYIKKELNYYLRDIEENNIKYLSICYEPYIMGVSTEIKDYNRLKNKIIINDDDNEKDIDNYALNEMIDSNTWNKIKVNINDLEHICRENNIPLCFAYSRLAYEGIISYGSKEYNEHKEKIN